MNRHLRRAAPVLCAALLLAGCAGSTPPPPGTPTSPATTDFARVQQIFDQKCTRCHGAANAAQELRLDSWDHLIAGSAHGEAVIPYDAERSLLVRMATVLDGGPHPQEAGAEILTDDELGVIRRWIDGGARNASGDVPYADARNLLYVANQGGDVISVIDTEAHVVIRTVDLRDLGFSHHAMPHHVAVEADGSAWYVSLIGANRVLKLNRENELVGQAEFEVPGMVVVDKTSDRLYVGRSMMAVSPPQRIGVAERDGMKLEEVGVFFPRPHALAVSADGRYAFSASLAENQLATVDAETEEASITNLEGATHTIVQFAVSPDGGTLVGTGQVTGQLLVFDVSNPPRVELVKSVPVRAQPWHPVFTPDGRYVYVGNKEADAVTIFDVEKLEVAGVIEGTGLSQPHGSAVRPDGRYVYISNNNLDGQYTPRYRLTDVEKPGTVVVIDTATNAIVKILEVGPYATGMGL